MLKVIVACGNGMGTSSLIKMKVETVFRKLGVDAEISHGSVGDAASIANQFDIVFCPVAFASAFKNVANTTKVLPLKNILDSNEITAAIKENGIA